MSQVDANEKAVAAIVKARKGKRGSAKKPRVAPAAPAVLPARNADGTFAKGTPAPCGTPFVPGQSGNPAGRPRMASALIKAGEEVDALFPDMPRVDAAALALWRKAMHGDVTAFKEIADRTEGKVSQPVEVGNKGGEAFEVNANGSAAERLASVLAGIAAREAAGAGAEDGGAD